MKKLIVLLAIFSFAVSVKAANEMDYAIVHGKTYFCEHAIVVFNKIKLHTEDGMYLNFPLKEVDAYSVNGRIFHHLPLLCKKGEVKHSVFLELIAQRNGLKLYRYCSMNNKLGTCFEDKTGQTGIYLVYNQDNEFHLCVDEKNMQTVLPFFHINTD